MDLYEYQAKELFAAHGVPVLPGRTVEDAEAAAAAAAELGTAVVVKAQVKTERLSMIPWMSRIGVPAASGSVTTRLRRSGLSGSVR